MTFCRRMLLGGIVGLGLLALPGQAAADIYKYVDGRGIVHLTNVPIGNVPYEVVHREKRVLFSVVPADAAKYEGLIEKAARKYQVDSALIKAIIKAESNFNSRAVSPKGARGLMQLMPRTAHALQVQDSFHPESNIEGGTRYLKYLLRLFSNNLHLAVAAYNAGENAVIRYNGIPPYRETQTYVQRVLSNLDTFRRP